MHPAYGPRIAISVQEARPCPAPPRHRRLPGKGWCGRRHRDHGLVLRGAAKNVLDRRTWATRQELRIAFVMCIERTYHRRRRQSSLGRLTPVEDETIMTTPATQEA